MTILKKVRYFNKNLTHRLSKNVNQYQAKRVGHITDAQQYTDKLDSVNLAAPAAFAELLRYRA
ncbi:hypothetical protein KC221_25590, partial [Mycobacterium tuberculosis]|nr:hypothetical protein [Mycobacterium tuberculosis]